MSIAVWIRLAVVESPIFQEALDAKSTAKMPVLDALKTYPKEIALAAGSFVATNATFYIVSVWLISYATTKLGYDRTAILTANAALSLFDISASSPGFAQWHLSHLCQLPRWKSERRMSANGTKRTFALVAIKSAFDPKRTLQRSSGPR